MNGFNRFDPKYVSIGPKALREQKSVSNSSKCATLRHAGRYGGGLTERGLNPVLKRASPPNVATFQKKLDIDKINILKSKQLNCKTNNFTGSSNIIVLDSEDECGISVMTLENQPKNVFNNMTSKYNKNHQTSTVYSIETSSYQPSPKNCRKINSKQPSAINVPISCENSSISILKQPLPEIPNGKQPLSASNLKKFEVINNMTDKNRSKSYDIRMEILSLKKQSGKSFCSSIPTQVMYEQPPQLPPKNKNKNKHIEANLRKNNIKMNLRNNQNQGTSDPCPFGRSPEDVEHFDRSEYDLNFFPQTIQEDLIFKGKSNESRNKQFRVDEDPSMSLFDTSDYRTKKKFYDFQTHGNERRYHQNVGVSTSRTICEDASRSLNQNKINRRDSSNFTGSYFFKNYNAQLPING